jgi:hypothetical protein
MQPADGGWVVQASGRFGEEFEVAEHGARESGGYGWHAAWAQHASEARDRDDVAAERAAVEPAGMQRHDRRAPLCDRGERRHAATASRPRLARAPRRAWPVARDTSGRADGIGVGHHCHFLMAAHRRQRR